MQDPQVQDADLDICVGICFAEARSVTKMGSEERRAYIVMPVSSFEIPLLNEKKSLYPFRFVRSDRFPRHPARFLLKPTTERDRLESRLIDKGKLLEREGRKAAGLT